jgi:PTH1 family peptidyl-tRNA hydrolase
VDRLAKAEGIAVKRHECRSLTGRGRIEDEPVLLAKPMTYMNASGEAILGLLKKAEIDPDHALVIVDEVELPLGSLRLKPRGSAGGHNGLKSVEACLGSRDYPRLRIGVRGPHYSRRRDLSDYVLDRFSRAERPEIEEALDRAAEAVRVWATRGIREAMNRFNAVPE